MSVWFTEAQYAFAFFGLLALLLIAPWVRLQYRRFGRFRGWPAVVSSAIVLYGCALIAFTMFPLPRTSADYCAKHADRSYWQLTPLASLDDVAAYAQDHTLVQTVTSGVLLQVVMNVILFIPLGFLLAYRWRQSLGRSVLVAFGLSLAIELTQGTGLWGLAECPYRLADVDDLLTNTAGGLVGWLLGRWLGRYLPDPVPHAVPDLDPPSVGRRALAVVVDVVTYLTVLLGVLVLDERLAEAPDRGTTPFVLLSGAVSLLAFVALPSLLPSRAGPGGLSVDIVLTSVAGGRAPLWSLLVRWAVRWLPFVLFGLAGLLAVLAVDAVVAWRRPDRRTLCDLASRTAWITDPSFVAASRHDERTVDAGTREA